MTDKETDTEYHQRALALAKENGTSLTRRQGGGAYLGILKEDTEARNRAWQLSGVPMTWGPTTLRTWMESSGWHVENLPKAPNGRIRTWWLQGYNKEEPGKKTFAYQVQIGSSKCNITVQRWHKQRKPTAEEIENNKQIKGARWWSADQADPIDEMQTTAPTVRFSPEIASTQMDIEATGESSCSTGEFSCSKRTPVEKPSTSPYREEAEEERRARIARGQQRPRRKHIDQPGGQW